MNSIKSIFLSITILFSISMVLISCNNDSSVVPQSFIDTSDSGDRISENIDSVSSSEKRQLLDSIATINTMVETLSRKVDMQTKSTESVDIKLTGYKQRTTLLTTIILALGLVSFIMAIIAFIKASNSQKRNVRHRSEIEQLKAQISNLGHGIQNQSRQKNNSTDNSNYYTLASRISTLESQLRYLNSLNKPNTDRTSTVVSNVNVVKNTRTGYFGMPSKMSETASYFKCMLDSKNDSDARFLATVNGNTAEFKPLEGLAYLNDFRTSETLKLAFDHTGCAPSEANSIVVITPGIAKLEDSRWIIIQKAKIKFRG